MKTEPTHIWGQRIRTDEQRALGPMGLLCPVTIVDMFSDYSRPTGATVVDTIGAHPAHDLIREEVSEEPTYRLPFQRYHTDDAVIRRCHPYPLIDPVMQDTIFRFDVDGHT